MTKYLKRFIRFLFNFAYEEFQIMSLLTDLQADIATLSTNVDILLANQTVEASAVAAAQAAQLQAETERDAAKADLVTAQAALADATANAVDQATVDSVTAINAKFAPAPVVDAPQA